MEFLIKNQVRDGSLRLNYYTFYADNFYPGRMRFRTETLIWESIKHRII